MCVHHVAGVVLDQLTKGLGLGIGLGVEGEEGKGGGERVCVCASTTWLAWYLINWGQCTLDMT